MSLLKYASAFGDDFLENLPHNFTTILQALNRMVGLNLCSVCVCVQLSSFFKKMSYLRLAVRLPEGMCAKPLPALNPLKDVKTSVKCVKKY